MVRKFFIALLCFMFVPIVCSQALGASAWYVINDSDTIKYAQDTTTTEYNSAKWSSAATTVNSLKDFFSLSSLIAGDTVYIKDGTFTIAATIEITKNVTVYGGFNDSDSGIDSRTGTTTIKGGTSFSGSVIKISSGTVTLDGLTITGGNTAANEGGGVYNSGTLTMTNCTVTDNTADDGGGGVYNSGTLIMTNCTVTGNTASDSYGEGGGVYNEDGTLTMTNCTISGNTGCYGGGVYNEDGTLTMTNCTVTGNTVGDNGSGGGVYNDGTLTMTNCTISGNTGTYGGGVYNDGTLTMTNCTVTDNTLTGDSSGGGGVYNGGTLTMTNTFVWGDANNVIHNNNGTITATYSAFPSGLNVTGITLDDTTQNNIAIASWNTRTSKDVTVNGVTHTVYRIEDNTDLERLEGSGTKTEGTPNDDQLGHTRNPVPCIGAVERVKAPVLSNKTLTIDAIEGKSITSKIIEVNQGLDIAWSASGTLPGGLVTLSADKTFTISGTPETGTAANSPYTYTITAKNDADEAQTVVTINVTAAPVLSCDNVIILSECETMTDFTITATNKDTVTWAGSGTLPDGLTYSSKDNTFTITGTPNEGTSANSPYKYTVTAENTAGKTQALITIIVTAKSGGSTVKPVLSESAISYTNQEGYTIEAIIIRATAGNNLTWSASGTLPDGLTGTESSDNTGYIISGTLEMNTEGSYTYTVTAKNDGGEANCTVNITVEKFELNLDELPEPETNQTLSKYLTETLGLSTEQLATLTDFKIPAKITSLNGIAELMPNLKTLDLSEAVSLGANLDLSVLGNLQLEKVNLSGNSAIKTLNLKGCNIKNVNAEECTGLISIDVAGNEFIEELQISSTDISEINANGCKNLKTLHFANSKVSKLDLTGCVEMRDLDFKGNSIRRFNKDHFGLDKLEKLKAKNQRANKSLIEKIFDLVAFMRGNDEDGISTAGLTINSAVSSGDENLINVTGYDESGNVIECDDSEYPETGKITFDKSPAKIIYNYDTGLNNSSMDVTISGTPDDDEESLLGSSGGCDSGFASGALLALTGLALIHKKKH